MIRKSSKSDIQDVVKIYEKIIEKESSFKIMTGWKKNLYPSHHTALEAHNCGELFVMEIDNEIAASAIINQNQICEYADCEWEFKARNNEIMVLHTLAVDPEKSGKGYATDFISFYENYALENSCRYLRLDTNVINSAARALYKKLGYKESGIILCKFNGIEGIQLVCLEKKID
ncbi:GNAT family N-acetyltransferase [Brucepastera parasyntrophica]|uniref:GNAT family N-acetyltransferase n=1 Tax=Brucepastera parasyntrophica TaxID=2880008 RepID=UPI00210B3B0F|nr:GNAT family N-acetyltransferase [Brucepastera parasyntrophica]ULQ59418.1 GNAT family N-acetyltransferase [Brucepastera parasyntrophica]